MGDPRQQLSELARRVESAVESGSLASERAVQLRAAEPLIEVLGWDVRSDAVQPEATLGGHSLDYLLTVDGQPGIAVVTGSPDEDLDRATNATLRPVLEERHAPRGLATDGRRVVLLLVDDDDVYTHSFAVEDVERQSDALERFHRSRLEDAIAVDRDRRLAAARRLAEDKESVASTLADDVLAVTGPELSDLVTTETSTFVDDLVETLAPGEELQPSESGGEPSAGSELDPGVDDGGGRRSESAPADDRSTETVPVNDDGSDAVAGGAVDSTDDLESIESDGSYVARFFGGSSSVGAVGTGSPRATTVGVVRYLLENQDLRRSVTFPWEFETGTAIVAEQRPSEEWIALENPSAGAVYVRPVDDPSTAERVIEGLAEAVGLRVMFQGDW